MFNSLRCQNAARTAVSNVDLCQKHIAAIFFRLHYGVIRRDTGINLCVRDDALYLLLQAYNAADRVIHANDFQIDPLPFQLDAVSVYKENRAKIVPKK